MRRRIAQGLTMLLFVGFGAAQGPISSGSTRHAVTEAVLEQAKLSAAVIAPAHTKARPYQVGTASWYGEYFEGRPTASGEPYNMYDLTAAHPTLPLGTLVRVTNLRNRRAVIVRVNDRGPVVEGRIIDLSYSAAKVLRFENKGLQRVRLDVVPAQKAGTAMALLFTPDFGR